MKNKNLNHIANKLVKAFLNNKIISPIPSRYTKKISEAQKLRKKCESKIKKPIIGFKAAGTGIPVLKKLKEKEPFYSAIYKHNFLVKILKIIFFQKKLDYVKSTFNQQITTINKFTYIKKVNTLFCNLKIYLLSFK